MYLDCKTCSWCGLIFALVWYHTRHEYISLTFGDNPTPLLALGDGCVIRPRATQVTIKYLLTHSHQANPGKKNTIHGLLPMTKEYLRPLLCSVLVYSRWTCLSTWTADSPPWFYFEGLSPHRYSVFFVLGFSRTFQWIWEADHLPVCFAG